MVLVHDQRISSTLLSCTEVKRSPGELHSDRTWIRKESLGEGRGRKKDGVSD